MHGALFGSGGGAEARVGAEERSQARSGPARSGSGGSAALQAAARGGQVGPVRGSSFLQEHI